MTGLLILAQDLFGRGLLHSAEHVLGTLPTGLETVAVDYAATPDVLLERLRPMILKLEDGDGVMILADIFGSSHCNAACQLVRPGQVELIAGVNLPMLIRVINYRARGLTLSELLAKARSGGIEGVVCAPLAHQATGS